MLWSDNTIAAPCSTKDGEVIKNSNPLSFILQNIGFNKDGYSPCFALGITMGVHLDRWRDVLSELDTEKNGSMNKNSLLLYNSGYIKDLDPNRELRLNTFSFCGIKQNRGLIHTKLILIMLKNNNNETRFVMLVSSKNISGSESFDLTLPLYSVPAKDKSASHGSEAAGYIRYLCSLADEEKRKETERKLAELLELLPAYDFTAMQWRSGQEPEREYRDSLTRLDGLWFSYPGHWFSKEQRDEIFSCSMIVSPYSDSGSFKRIIENNRELFMIGYDESFRKIYAESPQLLKGRLSTGPFHAKLYVRKDAGHTVSYYLGSANLTKEALGADGQAPVNSEMIVKLTKSCDDDKEYDRLKKYLFGGYNKLITEFDPENAVNAKPQQENAKKSPAGRQRNRAAENSDRRVTDKAVPSNNAAAAADEEEEFLGSGSTVKASGFVSPARGYAVEWTEDLAKYCVISVSRKKLAPDITRPFFIEQPCFWIIRGGDQILLSSDTYLSDDETDEYNKKGHKYNKKGHKALKWSEYEQLVNKSRKSLKASLDLKRLFKAGGLSRRSSGSRDERADGSAVSAGQSMTGCCILSMMQNLIIRNRRNSGKATENSTEAINRESIKTAAQRLGELYHSLADLRNNMTKEDEEQFEMLERYYRIISRLSEEGSGDNGKRKSP